MSYFIAGIKVINSLVRPLPRLVFEDDNVSVPGLLEKERVHGLWKLSLPSYLCMHGRAREEGEAWAEALLYRTLVLNRSSGQIGQSWGLGHRGVWAQVSTE